MKTAMVTNPLKNFLILGLLPLALLLGCAKEMDERLPDNAHRDIHPIQSFNKVVTLETVGDQGSMFYLSANEVERQFLAINEARMMRVRFIDGPDNLKYLFRDLRVEGHEPGERIQVLFRLTESRVSAFRIIENDTAISTASRQLVRNYRGHQIVPLFHYGQVSFGKYIERLNHIDEPTRFRDFEVSDRASASHVRFTATAENRKLDGLYGESDASLMVKNRLHNREWSSFEITRFFDISNQEETATALSPIAPNVISRVIDNNLFVYRIVSRASLNPVKERLLESGDLRIVACTEDQRAKTDLTSSECVLEAILKQSISHVRLDLKTENGQFTGSVRIERDADPRVAQIISLPLEKQVQIIRYDDIVNIEEENLFRRRLIEDAVHSSEEINRLLNSNLESAGLVQTRLVGQNLLFMVPRSITSLNSLEYAAFRSGDPRFGQCPNEILREYALEEECVMVTTHYRRVSYADIRLRVNENQDLRDVVVDRNVNRDQSQLLYIDTNEAVSRYVYSELIGTGDQVLTVKSRDFDLDAEYLYVPFSYGAPREVLAANPFFKGQEKIVNLRFTREGLEVYERERDERFRANSLNDKPVLLIPGSHLGVNCVRDDQGDCTMTDIPDTHLRWDEAPLFLPEFRRITEQELNMLQLMSAESDPCVYHTGTQLVDYTVKKGVINIELEKTYKTVDNWRCVRELFLADTHNYSGLSNAGFKVQYHYSLVKLDDLASPDYEPIQYPLQEHRVFGFFKNFESSLNDFFDSRRMEEDFLLNRWNPNLDELVYHLSDTFNEPGQELIKEATYNAVDGINRSLQEANVNFRIRLVEPSGIKPGDLRYNVIQLVTDPLSNGLLGYAPSVKNPRTGEIVSAHINMYSGVVRSLTPRIWDNMVDHTIKQRDLQRRTSESTASDLTRVDPNTRSVLERFRDLEIDDIDSTLRHNSVKHHLAKLPDARAMERLARANETLSGMDTQMHNAMLSRMRRTTPHNYVERRELSQFERMAKLERERLDYWAKNNAFAVEFFRVAHTAKALIPGIIDIPGVMNADNTLKRWSELTDAQKQAAGNIIVPYAYTSTFVHEFGHNLGLRHNFAGSYDAANFYTDQEARARGLNQAPAYSSIMDYAYSEMNELTIFGKYDVAALRYAYAREVELENGEFVQIETTLTDLERELQAQDLKLRDYRFCTDENAGLSATCNRFDEGTNLVEITNHLISRYQDTYRYINFRDGRNTFKDTNILGITMWNMRLFEKIRDIFEEWEFFSTIFGEPIMVQGCGPEDLQRFPVCQQINDRRDAVQLAGQFFIDVLKTPDHLCAILVENAEGENEVKTRRLSDFYEAFQYDSEFRNNFPTSCFDPRVASRIENGINDPEGPGEIMGSVVGETGRFLNDIRGNDDRNIYADDRTVVGTWVDRLLAARALLKRQKDISITETGHMSMVEHPALIGQFMGLMGHILLNEELENGRPFVDRRGNRIQIPYSINQDIIESTADHLLGLKQFFGLNTDSGASTSMTQALMSMIEKYSLTNEHRRRDQALDFYNLFAVRRADITAPLNHSMVQSVAVGDTIYSTISDNLFSNRMIDSINAEAIILEALNTDQELLARVIQARLNPTAHLDEIRRFAITIHENLLTQLIQLADADVGHMQLTPLLEQQFDEATARALLTVYVDLGAEGMREALFLQQNLGNIPPDDAGELERALYSFNREILRDLIEGTLEENNDFYKENLRYLLNHRRNR